MEHRAKRKVISINEEKCTGCGLCVPDCPEGALQVIGGKARLVSEPLCDGLGACLGVCPEGALTVEERDTAPYDEKRVMENIVRQGAKVLQAHLEHLRDHGQTDYLQEALDFLREKGLQVPPGFWDRTTPTGLAAGPCPGIALSGSIHGGAAGVADLPSLRNWPVQLHLVQPSAPQFRQADLLLAADCVAYALADFHRSHLPGKALAIACPKLDAHQDLYPGKLKAFLDDAGIRSLTVMTMEVPCCGGLLTLARETRQSGGAKVPLRSLVVGIRGNIIRETNW